MKKLILTLMLLLLLPATAFAEGYLVTLKEEPIMLCSADTSLERVPVSDEIMYKADSIEDIESTFSDSNIIEIIPNSTFTLFDAPNDTYYSNQWNLRAINAFSAYQRGIRGKDVTVGVIDSGLNIDHEDLDSSRVELTYNVFDGTDDVTDEVGHGTFVTGTIAAITNNSLGIAGIADQSDLYIYKIFNGKETTFDKLILGINHAIDDGCDVINMSFGASEKDLPAATINKLQRLINKARNDGIIIAVAVGNNYSDVLNYPAACDGVIGVGSVGESFSHSSFSNYNDSVCVTAPGEMLSGLAIASSSSYTIAKYANRGTSYSTPIVTAMAALAKQIDSDITVDEMIEVLKDTSTDLGTTGYDTYYGWGLVNIEAFVDELLPAPSPSPIPSPTAEPTATPTAEPTATPTPIPTATPSTPMSITFDKSTSTVFFYDVYEAVDMYTAFYENGILVSLTKNTLQNSGEITLPLSDNYDTAKLFFWRDMAPVKESVKIIKADEE